jgi:hypothetical protein
MGSDMSKEMPKKPKRPFERQPVKPENTRPRETTQKPKRNTKPEL